MLQAIGNPVAANPHTGFAGDVTATVVPDQRGNFDDFRKFFRQV
jgi:hypothetical protein